MLSAAIPAALPAAGLSVSEIDVATLFMLTMQIEIMLGLLLYFAWAQNFHKRALAWWGSAHVLRALSILLFGMSGTLPGWASIDLANAALFASFAVTWSGARVFDGRSAEPIWGLVGVAIWLCACRLPQFAAATELRALVGSGIVAAYTWLAAYEFWRGRAEALVSRWPAIFMLFAHGALFLLRTPLGASQLVTRDDAPAASAWLEVLSLEALLFTISIAFILLAMAKERADYRHRSDAVTDSLTGIANRRGVLEQAAAHRQAGARPAAAMLFDLDDFKAINDRSGHAAGDRVLQIFAGIATAEIGAAGFVGRWGGDEFAAVIYDTVETDAAALAERIRAAFLAADTGATVSVGMTMDADDGDLLVLLAAADRALYLAKAGGRNRVEIAMPESADAAGPAPDNLPAPPVRRHRTAA